MAKSLGILPSHPVMWSFGKWDGSRWVIDLGDLRSNIIKTAARVCKENSGLAFNELCNIERIIREIDSDCCMDYYLCYMTDGVFLVKDITAEEIDKSEEIYRLSINVIYTGIHVQLDACTVIEKQEEKPEEQSEEIDLDWLIDEVFGGVFG